MITANKVEVRLSTTHGFGVFAKENIQKGEIIEESPIFHTNIKVSDNLCDLNDYCWEHQNRYILGFGLSSLFNCVDDNPNCVRDVFLSERLYRFTAAKDIKKDEELFINYVSK